MAEIEFTKKYQDGRIVTVTYRDDLAEIFHDKRHTANAAKKRAIKNQKNHQDVKYYNAFHNSGEKDFMDAYMDLCKSLEWD